MLRISAPFDRCSKSDIINSIINIGMVGLYFIDCVFSRFVVVYSVATRLTRNVCVWWKWAGGVKVKLKLKNGPCPTTAANAFLCRYAWDSFVGNGQSSNTRSCRMQDIKSAGLIAFSCMSDIMISVCDGQFLLTSCVSVNREPYVVLCWGAGSWDGIVIYYMAEFESATGAH